MRIQLWSYNYDPEPSGIAPLSGVWARAMQARGHDVQVIAAHPHYPEPQWGRRLKPYRELRDGIPVLRLPLWVGRGSALQRMRQEATFTTAMSLAAPTLKTPDVIVAVSPSFPALVPAMANARARRIPWVLWLQDILPDGATMTGILEEGRVVRLARRLERAAYPSAPRSSSSPTASRTTFAARASTRPSSCAATTPRAGRSSTPCASAERDRSRRC